MARKPKTQPNPEAAAAGPVPEPASPNEASGPVRRGRKPKAAAPLPASLPTSGIRDPSTDDVDADAPTAAPTKTPGRRGPGRKRKQAAAALPQDAAVEQAGAEAHLPAAEPAQTSVEGETLMAETAFQPDAVGAGDAGHGDARAREASSRAAPAAHWDRATGAVRFDWPEIERVALAEGPDQAMAKLLVAARAEGAGSRWPF